MEDFLLKTYFEIFGLSPNILNVNLHELEDKFFELQLQFHPDKTSNLSAEEREQASINSSLINKAFYILQDEFLRAEYWLKIHGFNEDELNKISLSQEFLMEAFEWREQLFELEAEEKSSFVDSLKTRYDKSLLEFKHHVSNNKVNQAALTFVEVRFIKRFLDENTL